MAAGLLVLCADCFFHDSDRKKMLAGLGDSGGQQPDHLCDRVKNRSTGLHSGESVLYCALRGQPSNVAQGRVLLSRASVGERNGDVTTVSATVRGCSGLLRPQNILVSPVRMK